VALHNPDLRLDDVRHAIGTCKRPVLYSPLPHQRIKKARCACPNMSLMLADH